MTDEQIKDALLPCPFCGSNFNWNYAEHIGNMAEYGGCSNLKCIIHDINVSARDWNTRPQPQTVDDMAKVREALEAIESCYEFDTTYPAGFWRYEDAGMAVEEHWETIRACLKGEKCRPIRTK
jgi:hypothetical protein